MKGWRRCALYNSAIDHGVEGGGRGAKRKDGVIETHRLQDRSSRRVSIPRHMSHADQGSDLNVVYMPLVEKLGLQLRKLSEIDSRQMFIGVASGDTVPLKHWVFLNTSTHGIYRRTWAVVAPATRDQATRCQSHQLVLLLGIPWLYSVCAMIDIKEESLYIGDPSIGETRTELAVPTMVKPTKAPPAPWCETESEDDGSDSESIVRYYLCWR